MCVQIWHLPNTMDRCFLGPFMEQIITLHEDVSVASGAEFFEHLATCDYQRDLSEALVYCFIQKRIVVCVLYQLNILTPAPYRVR